MSNIKKSYGFVSLSSYIDICLRTMYKTKGTALKKIIYDWNKIVGEEASSFTTPYKVSTQKQKSKIERILHIFVTNSAFSSELHYMSNIILEKISFYVGSNYITRLKIDLNPIKRHIQTEEKSTKAHIDIDTKGIEDEQLALSLKKLGQAILSASR